MHHFRKFGFIASELLTDSVFAKPRRILFSDSSWKTPLLRFAFCFRHNYQFADLSKVTDVTGYDHVIPLCKQSYLTALQHPALFGDKLLAPSAEVFDLCDDKEKLYRLLRHSRFSKYIPSDATDTFPLILKPVSGANSQSCEMIETAEQLSAALELTATGKFALSEMIAGKKEYALHLLIQNKVIKKSLCIEYEFTKDYPIKSIDVPIAKRIVRERYNDLWQDLLAHIDYEGVCCINYKVRDGIPQLIEINPRIGGSLCEYFFAFVRHLNRAL